MFLITFVHVIFYSFSFIDFEQTIKLSNKNVLSLLKYIVSKTNAKNKIDKINNKFKAF